MGILQYSYTGTIEKPKGFLISRHDQNPDIGNVGLFGWMYQS